MTTAALPPHDLLAAGARRQLRHAAEQYPASQKERGQFFTPAPVARFMASLLTELPGSVRVIDPGAGAGMLSAAVCERIACLRSARRVEIHAYETDKAVLTLLGATLDKARAHLKKHGHTLEYTIHARDFVLDGPGLPDADLFGTEGYDVAILNPPYFKIGKDSPYAAAMENLVHGQPNLYALFMAVAAQCLKPGGQFVSITPRSFCNGPYFRSFRRWFLSRVSVERLHMFESRTDAFAEADVLQENVITYGRRDGTQASAVRISRSEGRDVPKAPPSINLDGGLVIDGVDRIVRIPTSKTEVGVIRAVESWAQRFEEVGLRVSTGPVVLFRAAEFVHRGHDVNGHIPLLAVQNVHAFRTVWPVKNAAKTLSFEITPRSRKLLVPGTNYVLMRRFSAKEEARRLVASPLFAGDFGGGEFALENHLNYVYHADRSLTRDETMGITAMLNSRLLDVYFRTISGNTQVNAAEVRAMPFPELPVLARLGRLVGEAGTDHAAGVERAVLDTLGINGTIRKHLTQGQD